MKQEPSEVPHDAARQESPALRQERKSTWCRESGEHPDWDEYRQAMVRQGKSLLRVTPVRWGPVATGGFPARLA